MITKTRNRQGVLTYALATQPKTKSRLEHLEQQDTMSHIRHRWPHLHSFLFHVPNESSVPVQYRAKLARCGILPGVSDIMLTYPCHGHPYAVIELKRARKRDSSISKDQVKFLLAAESVGAFAVVCYGYKTALEAMKDYLDGTIPQL